MVSQGWPTEVARSCPPDASATHRSRPTTARRARSTLTPERGRKKPGPMGDVSHEYTRRERGGVVCEDLDNQVIDDDG